MCFVPASPHIFLHLSRHYPKGLEKHIKTHAQLTLARFAPDRSSTFVILSGSPRHVVGVQNPMQAILMHPEHERLYVDDVIARGFSDTELKILVDTVVENMGPDGFTALEMYGPLLMCTFDGLIKAECSVQCNVLSLGHVNVPHMSS
jgi:hypothetical protein